MPPTAIDSEPIITRAVRGAINDVRQFLGARPVPPALWIGNGKVMHLADEVEFSLDIARRRWQSNPDDLAGVIASLAESDRFLRAFWGPRWHEQVPW